MLARMVLFGQQVKEITGSDISLCFYIDSQPVLDWLQQDYWKGKKYFRTTCGISQAGNETHESEYSEDQW